ncbi:putative deoxyhypusine synthase, partial [Trichostrongylus colubriformis]
MDDSGDAKDDLSVAQGAVLVKSCEVPRDAPVIRGYDFNDGVDFSKLMASYLSTGFQATHLAKAIKEVNAMLDEREISEGNNPEKFFPYPLERRIPHCTIFLGYTSNLVSSGLREIFRFVVQHDLVDCVVTSAGGVEEDLIKCLLPSYLGDFRMDGTTL